MNQNNLLIVQSGGPTTVINATLSGILQEAYRHPNIGRVLGARSGVAGILRGDLADLRNLSPEELIRLRISPGAALGTSRFQPSREDLDAIVQNLRRFNVRYLALIGGNGTMRGAEVIGQSCKNAAYDIQIVGIPKTIDNDIVCTDRCPGYGSAARFVAQATRDIGMDVRSLSQPVSIFETLGRNVGWLAAAAASARRDEDDAPHLIYLPERPFDTESFLSDVDNVVTRLGWAIVVVSEGLQNAAGNPIYEIGDPSQADPHRRPMPGGVGRYLANVVASRLKLRCRSEQPGLIGRSSAPHVSSRDCEDAELVGRAGVLALLAGHSEKMVSLRPLDASGDTGYDLVSLKDVAGKQRRFPAAWLSERAAAISKEFLDYVRPLIGDLIPYHPHF